MALFKVFRGKSTDLPEIRTDGYCYFTTDDQMFYIDYKDENGEIQRAALNAGDAETILGASLETVLNYTDEEFPTSKAIIDELDKRIVQSDWNQNDETDTAYIKNRTHYSKIDETVIIEEQTVTTSSSRYLPLNGNIVFTNGQTYYITFNGTIYECIAWKSRIDDSICIGNGRIYGGPIAGDNVPFCIDSDSNGSVTLTVSGSGTYTVSVKTIQEVTVQIPIKYIPDYHTIDDNMSLKNVTAVLPSSTHSVTYGNGRFVTVCYNSSKAAYSDDGINWTETALPINAYWKSVAYGNSRFVAVSVNNQCVYSDDGINWTETTLPALAQWQSVTYGNGRFVAVSHNSTIAAYSDDGIIWTATTLPSSMAWYSITYGNGRFVAVIDGFNEVVYSDDGITWTATNLPDYANLRSVTYGNGRFVAVSHNTTTSVYSDDGITWTATTLPSKAYWHSVTYGNGKFVVVSGGGYKSNKAAYSDDGINWTETTLPSSTNWYSVTYGNGRFVAVTQNSGIAAYSDDGINWRSEADFIYQNDENVTNKTAIALGIGKKQDKIIGNEGQIVGFDSNGDLVAADLIQSDWSQNDETAPDYVKNRPFYTTDPVETVLVEEQTVTIDSDGGYTELSSYVFFTTGETYIVYFNGTKYECVAWEYNGIVLVGNGSINGANEQGNGEPFIIECYSGSYSYLNVATAGTCTISVTCLKPEIVQIPIKYLQNSNLTNDSADGSLKTIGALMATGRHSFAEGYYTTASGDYSHAEGESTTASGESSHAEGRKSTASGQSSHAEGYSTSALGRYSHAEGELTIASGSYSHAEGSGFKRAIRLTGEANSTVYTYSSADSYVEVGNIILTDTTCSKIITHDKTNLTIVVDRTLDENNAINNETYEMYCYGIASGNYSHAEGYRTIASGSSSHAEGWKTSALGYYSHAEGELTIASGSSSHAEGSCSVSHGGLSHAEGNSTVSWGDYSHAEGMRMISYGECSHAEGGGDYLYIYITGESNSTTYVINEANDAIRVGSIIEKNDIYAKIISYDSSTLTIGVSETLNPSGAFNSEYSKVYCGAATGKYSHTEGYGTVAQNKSQHVQGEYNITDTEGHTNTRGTYAHIVGNGTSSTPSNAHTLDWSGNAWFSGDVYVGSTSGTNKDEGSVKLMKEVAGTQGQVIGFDADGNAVAQDMPSSIPSVTTSDNGKFLRVVDGAWAAATVPNAEEVSF